MRSVSSAARGRGRGGFPGWLRALSQSNTLPRLPPQWGGGLEAGASGCVSEFLGPGGLPPLGRCWAPWESRSGDPCPSTSGPRVALGSPAQRGARGFQGASSPPSARSWGAGLRGACGSRLADAGAPPTAGASSGSNRVSAGEGERLHEAFLAGSEKRTASAPTPSTPRPQGRGRLPVPLSLLFPPTAAGPAITMRR